MFRNNFSTLLYCPNKVCFGVYLCVVVTVVATLVILNSYGIGRFSHIFEVNINQTKSSDESQYHNHGQTMLYQTARSHFAFHSKQNSIASRCELIHIVVVCAGYGHSRTFLPLLKSILYNRKNPLRFHMVVNDQSKLVLETLFSTWDIPNVDVEFYPAQLFTKDVSWVPNTHYSGKFGLIKLSLISHLPSSIGNIIIVDTDFIFNSDIGELWNQFSNMKKHQVLGLVENQSDWYSRKSQNKIWPAVGKGFNTGVILVKLDSLSEFNWKQRWTDVTSDVLKTRRATQLADQDIMNAVVKVYPNILYKLPCVWNIQLSSRSNSATCLHNITDVKTLHWNSPNKLLVQNRHGEYFKRIHNKYLEFDGNLLRRDLTCASSQIPQHDISVFPNEHAKCYEFYRAASTKYRTHLFFLTKKGPPPVSNGVTLVLFLTMDRLHMVERIVSAWNDPISFTVYLTDPEAMQLVSYYKSYPKVSQRRNVVFHVVYKEGIYFPQNYLRNVGIRNVNTMYIFLSDVDFIPMKHFSYHFKNSINCPGCKGSKTVFVVPALNLHQDHTLPTSKTDVMKMMANGKISYFNTSQQKPDYLHKWKTAQSPYKITSQELSSPLIIVKKDIPLYDTRFVALSWNKESHVAELKLLQYKFLVLTKVFAIHVAHPPRIDNAKLQSSSYKIVCLSIFKEEFMKELMQIHNSETSY